MQSLRDCKGQVIRVALEVTVREIQAIGAGPCGVNPITEINVLSTPLALQIPMDPADLGSSATCSGKTSLISPTGSNPGSGQHPGLPRWPLSQTLFPLICVVLGLMLLSILFSSPNTLWHVTDAQHIFVE